MTSIQAYISGITNHLSETTRNSIQLSDTTGNLIEKILKNDTTFWDDLERLDKKQLVSVFAELEKLTNLVYWIVFPQDIEHPSNRLYDLDTITTDAIRKMWIIQDRVIVILNERETPIL